MAVMSRDRKKVDKMSRKPNPALVGEMSESQIADVLRRMVFTAARDWQRSVRMTRGARDLIVAALDGAAEARKMSEGFTPEALAEFKEIERRQRAARS